MAATTVRDRLPAAGKPGNGGFNVNNETNYAGKVYAGNIYDIVLPWSEACMAMKLAGKLHPVKVAENGAYVDAGRGPHITLAEAGVVRDENGELWARMSSWAAPGEWQPARR